MSWEFCLQDGVVSESFTHKMAAWEICLQDSGNAAISESFAYKTTAWEFWPTKWRRFWRFYPQDGGVEVLPTRWRHFWQSYLQDGGMGDLPTRWWQCRISESFTHKRVAWEFCLQDGGVSQSLEYILRLQCRTYLVNVTWPLVIIMTNVSHYND